MKFSTLLEVYLTSAGQMTVDNDEKLIRGVGADHVVTSVFGTILLIFTSSAMTRIYTQHERATERT